MPHDNLTPTRRIEAEQQQLRAYLYARASRDPKKRGRSVNDQMIENRREAEYLNATVVGEFIDTDRSASRYARRSREEYESMVDGIEAGSCDILIMWEASRASRDLAVSIPLRDVCRAKGVLWCLNGVVYDLTTRSGFKAVTHELMQAEDESEGIRDRVLRTVRLNAERGNPHGRILFGYRRVYNADTGELEAQVPDPVWGPVVQEIFRRLAQGDTAYSIAKDLESRGLKPPQRARWDGSRMIEIASNPSYLGKRVFQGNVLRDAKWDGLVDEKTWQAVQRVLRNPERRKMPDTIVKHLLTGIAVCGVCDCRCPLRVLPNRGRLTYTCSKCFCVAILETTLDAYVEEKVITWLSRPEAVEMLRPEPKEDEAFGQALAELEDLEGQLAEARSKASDPNPRERLSVASLMAIEAGLQPLIDAKKNQVQMLLPRMPLPELEDLAGAPDVDERWNALKMEKRRAVLRAVTSIEVCKGRRGSRLITPGRVVVALGPQERKYHPQARLQ